ncbi:metal ion ABC transporter substrate-binding protein/surface antigen [Gracilibacillus halophilus YIM-C55.5]|uniref:Metal ion ABC transporter substrate-binding protein/surface antigen n=1 Tax=Gracilibacillus halophilus YIM-C55.5 TaxID=1308866 RepID=N4WVB6_9BACI|nr:MetQ/NlpA family ABC transporter substrate-binding protein [Gracilibacillus halophilus]ENH98325.1 metal ion ABC transporter substrate-binding protein/surface antigen [Gracilibacillus halophilus YIM-C55.5]
MKKRLLIMMVVLVSVLVACNENGDSENTNESSDNNNNGESQEQTVSVAVVESPMLDVVEIAKENLAEEDIHVDIVEMGNYIQPNEALANEEVDANFSQHVPFMKQFNQNSDADLTEVQPIYYANFGLYTKEYASIDALPDDATIGIANDPSNIDRSLRLLAAHDLIKLKEIDNGQYGLEDIKEDSHNYRFEQAGIAALTRLYKDVDGIIVNPTHAGHLDLTPAEDALITEKEDNKFAITLVARKDNADSELIQKLADAMTSEEVRTFLNSREGEASIPAF